MSDYPMHPIQKMSLSEIGALFRRHRESRQGTGRQPTQLTVASRCYAQTRKGQACKSPAMPNGRCRMHGGMSLAGRNSPRYKHGRYTKSAIAEQRRLSALLTSANHNLKSMRGEQP